MNSSSIFSRIRSILFREQVPTKKKRKHQLRLMKLEDRRVLNASLSLNAGITLEANGAAGESLTVEDGGMFDVGAGDVETVLLRLSGGTWDNSAGALDGGLSDTLYDLEDGDMVLRVDASVLQDGGFALDGSNVLQIQGTEFTDSLTLNLDDADSTSNLDLLPTGGVNFVAGEDSGSGLDNDVLEVTGYELNTADDVADVILDHTGLESGRLTLEGIGSVDFDQIEPLALGGNAADLVINLPAGDDATVVLSDDGVAANGISQIDGLFELTTFTNPTNSLTINDPLLGSKAIDVQGLDADFDADLSILDADATDNNTVTFTGATITNGGDVTIEGIDVTSTAAGDITTTGDAADEAGGIVNIDAGRNVNLAGDIDTRGNASDGAGGNVNIDTVDGDITVAGIDASGAGTGVGGNVFLNANDSDNTNVTATGDVTNNGLVQTNNNGTVTFEADDSVNINANITAGGTGAVLVTANADIATDTNTTDGSTEAITMAAATTIDGGSGTITLTNDDDDGLGDEDNGGDITAQTLTTTAAAGTAITVNSDNDALLQGTVTTGGGDVDIDADRDIRNTAAIDSNGGDVDFLAGRDALIQAAITTDGGTFTANAVRDVTSTAAGDITTTGDAADEAGGIVDIDAGRNVNLAGDIDTRGNASDGAGGNVNIDTVDGDITMAGIDASGAGTGVGGNVFLNANDSDNTNITATGDVTNNGLVQTNNNGTVTFEADDSVNINANITAGGTGAVLVTANADIATDTNTTDGSTEAITMAAATTIDGGSGTITLTNDDDDGLGDEDNGGDITAQTLTTTAAAGTAITVNSDNDALLQGTVTTGGGDVDIDADRDVRNTAAIDSNGGDVDFLAGRDALIQAAINTDAGTFTANAVRDVTSTAAGDITTTGDAADEAGGIVDIDAGRNVNLAGDIDTRGNASDGAGGNVNIDTVDGDITVAGIDASGAGTGVGGNVFLNANDSDNTNVTATGDVTNNGLVQTNTNGTVTFEADDSVNINANITAGGTGAVLVTANADIATDTNTTDGSTESITMAAATTIDGGSGTITLTNDDDDGLGDEDNGGDITAQTLTTTAAAGTAITVNSDNDALLQGTVTTGGGDVDIDADRDVRNTAAIDSNGGDVDFLAGRDALIQAAINTDGGTFTANAVRDVTSTAAGDITTTGDAADEAGGIVDIDAGRNVNLAGDIDTRGNASDGAGGNVNIDTVDGDITVAGIDAIGAGTGVGGNIALNANDSDNTNVTATGDVTNNGLVQTNTNGTVTFEADDSVNINANITAGGTGAVLVTANADIATDTNTTDGSTESITMAAATTIDGGSGTITLTNDDDDGLGDEDNGGDITAQTLTTTAAAGTAITVNSDNDALLQGTVTTGGGDVDIDADRDIRNTAAIDSNGGDVDFLAGRDALIQAAVNTDGGTFTANAVRDVTSTAAGDITTTGDAADEAGGIVDIDAGRNVNLAGDIDTRGNASDGAGGNVNIDTVDGDMTVAGIDASGAGTGVGGNVALNANDSDNTNVTATGDVTNNGLVQTNNNGTVTFEADDSVNINANITAGGTGAVLVTANADIATDTNTTDGSTEAITMAAATTIDGGSGTITLTNDDDDGLGDEDNGGDITAQTLTTTAAAGTAITVNSDNDALLQGTVTTGGGDVDIDADRDIRNTAAIDSNGGDVDFLAGRDALIQAAITTDGGSFTANAVRDVTSTAAGTITTTGDMVDEDSGNVTLDAGRNVSLAATVDTTGFDNTTNGLDSDGGSIVINTVDGFIRVTEIDSSGGDVSGGLTDVAGDAGMISIDSNGATPRVFLRGNLTSAGGVNTNIAAAGDTRGNGASITFVDDVQIGDSSSPSIDTVITTSGRQAGDVTFDGAVDATTDGGTAASIADANDLTIIARDTDAENLANPVSGNVTFNMAVGGTTRLGQITITDANDVSVNGSVFATKLTQTTGLGNTTLSDVDIATREVAPIQDAVSITTDYDITLLGNISATDAAGQIDSTAATGETLTFTSIDGNVTVANNVILSTDEDLSPLASSEVTGDSIQITADDVGVARRSDGSTPDGTIQLGATVEVRTDGGVATLFDPRPTPGVANTAFYDFTPLSATGPLSGVAIAADPDITGVTDDQQNFLWEWAFNIGGPGEENLRVSIDWRDPELGVATIPTNTADNIVNSDASETFFVLDGDEIYRIGHVYTQEDISQLTLDETGPVFGDDFAVAHHDSIQVFGNSVQQDGTVNQVAGRTISSTDNPDTIGLEFENGSLEVRLPSVFLPPIIREITPPEPAPAPIAAVPPADTPLLFVNAVEPVEYVLTSFSTQSEDYFQLRKAGSNDPEPGFERIDDAIGWKLLQPQRLKQWVGDAELPSAEGYELWLITTKARNGEDVTFERPVLKFDIFRDQPFPMEEEILDDMPELKLERLDINDLGDIMDGDSTPEDGDNESTGDTVSSLQDSELLVPEDTTTERLDSTSRTASAAMATLAVSSLRRKRRPKVSENSSLISGVLGRITGK